MLQQSDGRLVDKWYLTSLTWACNDRNYVQIEKWGQLESSRWSLGHARFVCESLHLLHAKLFKQMIILSKDYEDSE